MGLKLTTDRYPPITSQTLYPLRHPAPMWLSVLVDCQVIDHQVEIMERLVPYSHHMYWGSYSTFRSIFHEALNLLQFNCEIRLESVLEPRTKIRIKFLTQGNNGSL